MYDQQNHPSWYPFAPSKSSILIEGRRGAHDNAIAQPSATGKYLLQLRPEFRDARAQMQRSGGDFHPRVTVPVSQVRQNRLKRGVARVQPLAHILAGRKLGVPVSRIVIIRGSFDVGTCSSSGRTGHVPFVCREIMEEVLTG